MVTNGYDSLSCIHLLYCDKSHYQNFTPPFDIPESWQWVRLGDVCEVARGGSPRPIKSYLTNRVDGINWIKIGDTEKDGKYINSTKEKIIPDGVSKSRLVHKGDFLLTNSMSFGRPYILNIDGCIHDGWLVISPIDNVFDKDFLYLLLSSEYAYYQFSDKASGSAVSNLNSDKVAESIFPLPPHTTQRRIVDEYERLSSFVHTIDNERNDLEKTIVLLKSKVLDLAMQGKLVPQDPGDEPAADLLRRINPKARIITDNPHYPQLPDNWVITTIESVCNYGYSQTVSVDDIDPSDWVLELEDLEKDSGRIITQKSKTERIINGVRNGFTIGDVLYSKLRTYLNKVLVAPEAGYCTTEIIPIKSYDCVIPEYLCAWLRSPFFLSYTAECCYGVKMPRLSTSDARKGIIPLPPINEQKRIVQKLNEISTSLEILSNSIG